MHASTRNIRRSDGRNVANEVWGKGGDFQLGEWQWCGFFCVVGIDFFGGLDCLHTFLTFFVKLPIPRNQKCQVVELGVGVEYVTLEAGFAGKVQR